MTTLLRCINGHEWQTDSAVATTSCPVCGAFELALSSPPTFPNARPALASDRSAPADPKPLSGTHLRAPAGPPTLEKYEILQEIGQGGMGVVYKAQHRTTGQVVAIKLIRKERLSNADLVNRFRREAMASDRLQHPSIVKVIETELDADIPYLALEFVPGITLQKLVEQTGPLPLAQACDFIRQGAVALQHAAEQRLVHRDIKPSNLMVVVPNWDQKPDAGAASLTLPVRPVIKVLDMGVARLAQLSDQDVSLTTLTRDGSVIGTPDYIAPEQLEDPRGVDIRADLYSLGCTFYFLLTGEVPFPGGSLIQKLDRQRWHTAPSVNQLRPDVPPALAAVVRRLLAKHPDDRYQTPGELIAVLETLLRTGELPGGYQSVTVSCVRVLTGHTGAVTAVAFCADGRSLITGAADHTLRLWDAAGKELHRFGDARHNVGCLAVTPAGIILAGQGVTVRAYDPATGRETLRLAGHNDAVRCLSVSANGKRLASGSDDRTVRIWDLERGREMHRFNRHKAGVTGVALMPDGRHVLSCSHDQTLRLWEISSGREVRSFAVPKGPVLCLALTADGQGAFTGHFDTTMRLWDVQTGRELRRFSGHKQMVGCAARLGEGVVSASHDTTLRLWDAASGAELATGQGHTGPVTAIAVSEGARLVATASMDQTVRLWQPPA